MNDDDYDNLDDVSVTKYKNYNEFLNKFINQEDKMYLEDEDLARDVKELYAVNKGDIKCREDFDRKKKEIEMLDQLDETKEKPLYSEGKTFPENTFLWHLATREYDVRNGRKSTIIFIRYREANDREISAYIDYRERLKNDNFEDIFSGKKDLVPRPSDLSYYNWTVQKVYSNDSTFFRVDAGPKERLSFRNNTDRKIINVDLEFLAKHNNLDVKRIPVSLKKEINDDEEVILDLNNNNNNKKTNKKIEKEKNNFEGIEKQEVGYKQIVIFDYETRSK